MPVLDLFRFSISYWLSFGKQYFSKYLSIYSSYPFYWHIVAHISLLEFCISVLSVVISPFSFLTLPILLFSLFFIMCLANSFSILFNFSKNQHLVFSDLCYHLLCFFYIYFCSVFFFFLFTSLY